MEKKKYNKPEVIQTEVDYSITITAGTPDINGTVATPSSTQDGFLNPMNWIKKF